MVFFREQYDKRLKDKVMDECKAIKVDEPNLNELASKNAGLCEEMKHLLTRNRLGVQRDPMQSKAKVGQQLIFSLIVASIFYDVGF